MASSSGTRSSPTPADPPDVPGELETPGEAGPAGEHPGSPPVTARGALRRSIVAWGWGQLAAGDRRGAAYLALQLAWLGGLALLTATIAQGSNWRLVFLLGAGYVAAWAAIAVDAYRTAVRRRLAEGRSGGDGGAIELLWLAVPVIVASTAFWTLGGDAATPETVLSRYVAAWADGRATEAATLFVTAPESALAETWSRQTARLRNELIRIAADTPPDSGIDPDAALASLRFDIEARGDRASALVRIVRRERVRDTFFGLVPTTTVRLVPVAELGRIELVKAPARPAFEGAPVDARWRIERLDLLGERVAG